MTWTLNGNTAEQTGTNTSLSGIEALTGVTLTSFGALDIYDMGTVNLEVQGTLTINGDDTGDREMLVIGNGGGDSDTDIVVATGGTLNIGHRSIDGAGEFSSAAFFPDIFEKDNLTFGSSNAKATSGVTQLGASANRGFLIVEQGGTLNWFGCINCSGGIGWDGQGNRDTTDAPAWGENATIRITDGVLDARRVTTRSNLGDNFIYQYSDDVEINGWTVICDEDTALGFTLLLVYPIRVLKGFKPVMVDNALGGSTTMSRAGDVSVVDYPGIIGDSGVDSNFVVQQNTDNTSRGFFLNSSIGSRLKTSADGGTSQDFAMAQIFLRQDVFVTPLLNGAPLLDSVAATQNRSRQISQGANVATAAQGVLTLPSQPINLSRMEIGGKEYTFQTTLTNVDGNIEVGASLAITKTNIENAINLTGTPGTGYATAMTTNPSVTAAAFSGDDMVLTAKVAGRAANTDTLIRNFFIPGAAAAGTGPTDCLFDDVVLGARTLGSEVNEIAVGRITLAEIQKDGDGDSGTNMFPEIFENPSSLPDDLWSVYLYSYLGLDRSRIDTVMRELGGKEIEFITPLDLAITATRSIADLYTDISDLEKLYDRAKSHKIDNVGLPVLELPLISASGALLDAGEYDIRIDGDTNATPLIVSNAAANRDTIGQGLTWAESTTATVPAGTARYLMVAIGQDNDPLRRLTGVDYGGQAMEFLGRVDGPTTRSSSSVAGLEVWGLKEVGIAAASTTTITPTWDVTPTNNKLYRASFTNVSQDAPISGRASNRSNNAERALAVDCNGEDEGIVLAFALNQSAGAVTFEGGLTERLDTITSGFGFAVADRFPTTDGLQSMDVTSTENILLAIGLRPRQGLMTIHTNQAPVVQRIGATEAISSGEDDEITIAFPAGIEDDDVAYIVVGHAQSGANAWNTPAGWVIPTGLTEVQTGGSPASIPGVSVFRRVLSSDSGSVTITNVGTNTSGIVAQMIVYRGMDTTTPEDVTSVTATGASGNPDPASITPVTDGSMILAIGFMDDGQQDAPTPPAGYALINSTQTPDGAASGE